MELTFEQYAKKYNLCRNLLVVKNFNIDVKSKKVDSIIQKELVKMYSPDYRQRYWPKSFLKKSFLELMTEKNISLCSVDIEEVKTILPKLGYEVKCSIIYSEKNYDLIISINNCERICDKCNGVGEICKKWTYKSSTWEVCDLCNGFRTLTWIDKIKKRNPCDGFNYKRKIVEHWKNGGLVHYDY